MVRKLLVLLLFALLFMPGCIGGLGHPRNQLLASEQLFTDTILAVHTLWQAGKLSPEEVERFKLAVQKGNDALDEWQEAIAAGEDYPPSMSVFQLALDTLLELQAAHEIPANDSNEEVLDDG
jgi:hypothetical protein